MSRPHGSPAASYRRDMQRGMGTPDRPGYLAVAWHIEGLIRGGDKPSVLPLADRFVDRCNLADALEAMERRGLGFCAQVVHQVAYDARWEPERGMVSDLSRLDTRSWWPASDGGNYLLKGIDTKRAMADLKALCDDVSDDEDEPADEDGPTDEQLWARNDSIRYDRTIGAERILECSR